MEPIIHLGRPWFLYWMFPYPATMGVWPQFRSPLEWDIWAVLTYLIVSIVFWYIGLVPDLATVRDRARKRGWQVFFGIFALGWRGSARHWAVWNKTYRTIAAIAVPLVVSVHSEVSLLFAAGTDPRLALDDLPALLRARRGIFRLRDGRDDRNRHAAHLPARADRHRTAPRRTRQGHCSRWG